MLVVAGPPGSGKTTYFPGAAFHVDSFNIDDRCAQLQGSYRGIAPETRRAVAKQCERFVREHIAQRTSFAVETTLRTAASIEQARLARAAGFLTHLRFLGTDSIALNVARVLQRAQAGGHGASERDIRDIYQASLSNLALAIATFERVRVYDSSAPWAPPRLIASARDGQLEQHGMAPAWFVRAVAAGH